MTRIVRTAYRYKRPPRKPQAPALADPVVVTKRARKPKDEPAATVAPPPANDDGKPAPNKPAIVTTASRKQLKLERASRGREDRPKDPEKWGRGPANG